jgi:hypothetical protein
MLAAGEIQAPRVRGYAVTPALREWYSSGDIEELEYVAMMHAARESLRLLAADVDSPRRRVVLAVEMPDQQVEPSAGLDEPGLVEISGPVPIRAVASGLVDDLPWPAPTPATRTPSSSSTAPTGTNCSGTRLRN